MIMPSVPSYIYQAQLMGSDITLKFYERQDKIAKQAFLLIKDWEDRLTANRPHTHISGEPLFEIAAVNAAAGQKPVQVSREVFTLLKRAQQISLYAGGCFNFAIGPIVKAWNIGFAQMRIPSPAEIAALLPLTNPSAVMLNIENYSVFLPQKGMALDLGAIAKGFIADCVKAFLQKCGVKAALINLGGNIHSLGVPAGGQMTAKNDTGPKNWTVGLQKPFGTKQQLLGLIHMAGKSVVTSGIYERYFIADNKGRQKHDCVSAAEALAALLPVSKHDTARAEITVLNKAERQTAPAIKNGGETGGQGSFYHHIFDPQTGYPLHNALMSVTIISDKSIDGEIGTSLLYGFGLEKGLEFLRDSLLMPSAVEAIFVTKDKRIILPPAKYFCFELLDKSYNLVENCSMVLP